jgi:hypothetical protein
MWNEELGAGKARPFATIVAEKRGWTPTDRRRVFLDELWKAATDLVNLPHHPEGQPEVQHFDDADARIMLVLTAALSSYVRGSA